MLLLLTNDDGVHADGLWALIKEAGKAAGSSELRVLAVAPDRERSACGHGISIYHPIEVQQIECAFSNVSVFAAAGTPADCVKLALEGMLTERPDFIISGINRGPNLGTDVFYSGTVSAAMEGALLGVKSMAISVSVFENTPYEVAADFAIRQAVISSQDDDWPLLTNVNIPAVSKEEIAGVAITRLGVQAYRDVFTERKDPKGRTWYWLGGSALDLEDPADSDTTAIRNKTISITPLLTDITAHAHLESLGKRNLAWPLR